MTGRHSPRLPEGVNVFRGILYALAWCVPFWVVVIVLMLQVTR